MRDLPQTTELARNRDMEVGMEVGPEPRCGAMRD